MKGPFFTPRRVVGILYLTALSTGVGFAFSSGVEAAHASGGAQAPPSETAGTLPRQALTPRGLDLNKVPDFVSVVNGHGQVVGYVPKHDLIPTRSIPATDGSDQPTAAIRNAQTASMTMTVYGPDLKTVVGHLFPDQGFVPLGTNPNDVPHKPLIATSW